MKNNFFVLTSCGSGENISALHKRCAVNVSETPNVVGRRRHFSLVIAVSRRNVERLARDIPFPSDHIASQAAGLDELELKPVTALSVNVSEKLPPIATTRRRLVVFPRIAESVVNVRGARARRAIRRPVHRASLVPRQKAEGALQRQGIAVQLVAVLDFRISHARHGTTAHLNVLTGNRVGLNEDRRASKRDLVTKASNQTVPVVVRRRVVGSLHGDLTPVLVQERQMVTQDTENELVSTLKQTTVNKKSGFGRRGSCASCRNELVALDGNALQEKNKGTKCQI